MPNLAPAGRCSQVTYVDLSDNYLVGQIPDSFQILAKPGTTVVLDSNLLSCCGCLPTQDNLLPSVSAGEAAALLIRHHWQWPSLRSATVAGHRICSPC